MTGSLLQRSHKRERCELAGILTPESIVKVKRPRRDNPQLHNFPSSFYDRLSIIRPTTRALREFNRRAIRVPSPAQPDYTNIQEGREVEVKRFARRGGPDLCDLRSYPKPQGATSVGRMSLSQPSTASQAESTPATSVSKKSKSTSAYDPNWEQHVRDNGIYPDFFGDEPANADDVRIRLAEPRPSLSPSRFSTQQFKSFQQQNDDAKTEADVMGGPLAIILGSSTIPHQRNMEFKNMRPLTDGTLSNPKPDLFDGSRPSDIHLQIRKELGPLIVPSANDSGVCAPNFFLEVKGPHGSSAVAKRQACYDGVYGARAMHALREYADPENARDDKAHTITSTYAGGYGSDSLKILAVYPVDSTDSSRAHDYRMTQLGSYAMTCDEDTFRKGATALRNARDWSQEQRTLVISSANLAVCSQAQPLTPVAPSSAVISRTCSDLEASTGELTEGSEASVNTERSRRRKRASLTSGSLRGRRKRKQPTRFTRSRSD